MHSNSVLLRNQWGCGRNSRWDPGWRAGKEPVDRTVTASSPVPDTLLSAPPVCIYFVLLGTRRGRDECAHFTDLATEASNPRHPAGEGSRDLDSSQPEPKTRDLPSAAPSKCPFTEGLIPPG